MRAADQPQLSTAVEANRDVTPVYRIVVALLSTLALLLVWRPAVVHGQQADGRIVSVSDTTGSDSTGSDADGAQTRDSSVTTHVVRAGETLWGIASRFYGDGHQWRALARRNRLPTTGAAPLQVGMKLTVPASRAATGPKAAALAAAPADSTVPSFVLARAGDSPQPPLAPSRPTGTLSAQTAGKANAAAGAAKGRASAKPAKATSLAMADTEARLAARQDTSRVNFQPQHASELMTARKGTRIGLVDLGAQEASRKSSEVETVFHRDLPDAAEAERRTRAVLRPNTPAPRQAEFEAAPFVVTKAELAQSGSIAKRVGASDNTESEYPQRAIMTDAIEVHPPAGVTYSVGQRLVAVTTPAVADKSPMIAIPTGIVEVIRVDAGKPVMAVLKRQSGRVEQGQRLLPATGLAAPWLAAQKLAQSDVSTTVRWIDPHELQPTLQSFLMLTAGTSQGVKAGDEFGLYRSGTKDRPSQELLVATVRVVRSEAGGSAAVITRQYHSDIAVGLSARRYSRAP